MKDALRRAVFQRSFERRGCTHLGAIQVREPGERVCAACVAEGMRTVHLRMCLTCGAVACCDGSPRRHARRHHQTTGHPLIRSVEPDQHWVWCYLDRAYLPGGPDSSG